MIEVAIKDLSEWIVEYAQGQLKVYVRKRNKMSSGDLYKSLSYRAFNRKGTIKIELLSIDYGKYVHFGRRPGKFPPVKAIYDSETKTGWLKDKGLRMRDPKTGSFVKATENAKKQAAFLIGRKIAKDGIAAYPFYTQAIEASIDKNKQAWSNLAKAQVMFFLK
jgi:hypothetical protein